VENERAIMKAIRISSHGDANALVLSENEPMPEPGPEQVLLKIHAAGLNFVDIYQRRGEYKVPVPFTPGLEGAGVIEKVGEKVTEFRRGARVFYNGQLGSYAEYAVVDAWRLISLPRSMSFEEGAAIPLQGMTAHYLITQYRQLKPGDTVLIHAAAGGVGLLLVQWAKHLGANVIGTVSTEEKARIAGEAGADHVVLYTKEDFVAATKNRTGGRGADLIIDGVGKSTFAGNIEAAALHGHIVIFGAASGPADPVVPNALMPKCLSLSGGTLFVFGGTRKEMLPRAKAVLAGIKAGWLKLRINHVFPLAQAAEAQRLLESRGSTGKVVLKVVS
jgi:NADPH:quinone reductase